MSHSYFISLLGALLLGCDASKTTLLFGELQSGISPDEARRLLRVAEGSWKIVENGHLPSGDRRPRFDILSVEIADFSDCGVKGTLALKFFNDRLTSTWFYPSDLAGYLKCLQSRGIRFEPKRELNEMERYLGGPTNLEIRVSHHTRVWLYRDYKDRDYVAWEDMGLSAEEEAWIRSHS